MAEVTQDAYDNLELAIEDWAVDNVPHLSAAKAAVFSMMAVDEVRKLLSDNDLPTSTNEAS